MSEAQVLFEFSDPIQRRIVAMLLMDTKSFQDNMEIIQPEFFDNPALELMATLAYAFYKAYHRPPATDELLEEFAKQAETRKNIPVDEYLTVFSNVCELADAGDFEYVKDKVIEFARFQGIKAAILESAEIVKKRKDYGKILEKVRTALAIGETSQDLGSLYFDNVEERLELRRSGDTRAEHCIRTGLDDFDAKMGGGIGPGELFVIMGPMKRGKTILSVNIGAKACEDGKAVAHYIMEGSEKRLETSYDSRISGVPKERLLEQESDVRDSVENWRGERLHGRLVIKHFPAASCSALSIENHLNRLKLKESFVPKLIIIDYLSLMVPSYKWAAETADKYFTFGQICKELLNLGQRWDVGIWLLHQSRRGTKGRIQIDLDDSADSLEPMRDADGIITLNQTEAEANQKVMRLFCAGGREFSDRWTSKVWFDKSTCKILDLDYAVAANFAPESARHIGEDKEGGND